MHTTEQQPPSLHTTEQQSYSKPYIQQNNSHPINHAYCRTTAILFTIRTIGRPPSSIHSNCKWQNSSQHTADTFWYFLGRRVSNKSLRKRSSVHLFCCIGWIRQPYYPHYSAGAILQTMRVRVTVNILSTSICPVVLWSVPSSAILAVFTERMY